MNHKEGRCSDRLVNMDKLYKPKIVPKIYVDVGCGNGDITRDVAKHFKIQRAIGIDIYKISNHIGFEYIQINDPKPPEKDDQNLDISTKIPIDSNSVDLVTCFMSIHHFSSLNVVISEIVRILKVEGCLFIREHDVDRKDAKLVSYLDGIHDKFPDHSHGKLNNYLSKDELFEILKLYGLRYLGVVTYPPHIKNPQKIYHCLFIKE